MIFIFDVPIEIICLSGTHPDQQVAEKLVWEEGVAVPDAPVWNGDMHRDCNQ